MQRVFWIFFAASGAVYLLMLFWSIPTISAAAGGLAPFDMRPIGYSVEEARAFLSALSEDGRQFYLSVQLRLDLIYPALLGLMLITGYQRVFPAPWSTVFSVVALTMVSADYLENYMVATMLREGAASSELNMVSLASLFTVSKFLAAVVSFSALLIGAVWQMRRKWT